jgi:hypothetical protein
VAGLHAVRARAGQQREWHRPNLAVQLAKIVLAE